MCFNEELWQHLFERFGGSVVKRFYIRTSSSLYTSVDVKLKAITIRFLNTADLRSGNLEGDLPFKQWWTQIGKNATLKDVKFRVHDHLRATGYAVELEDVRLWLFTAKSEDDDKRKVRDPTKQLRKNCTDVKKAIDGEI